MTAKREILMKIGLLGGTFNPIHLGHLVLAQECWCRLELDKVIFVPTHMPPHKEVACNVSPADRLNMVRLALEGDDRFEISTHEIDRQGTSYSVDSIRHFIDKYGSDTELFFLTGADSASELSMWKDAEDILNLCRFVIATRPGWDEQSSFEEKVSRITIPAIEVSSTQVRNRVRDRDPIDYIVPQAVVRYIRNKGFYRG